MNTSTIDGILSQLADLLGPLSPFTKAVVPAALALAVAVVNSIVAGSVNATSLIVAGTGLVAALAAYFLPNRPKKLPVVPPPVIPSKGPGR